ncbi:MBL fold metallo-hydrolase [soil metagenome]
MTGARLPATAADLPLVRSHVLGDLTIHALEAGLQWLDGGAMFGVVPKPLWERRIPADQRNRIPLGLRCLLVETADELVLVETGIGNKESAKFQEIYGVDVDPHLEYGGADRLQSAIHAAGFAPDQVTIVINTHLHFDHAGGNTYRDEEGEVQLSFPRARYFSHQGEWDYAHRANERTRASYFDHNYHPLRDAGRLTLLEGDSAEVVPGISTFLTPGHTPFHQSVLIRSAGDTACFLSDVLPTMAHLPLPWIMGYDVEPLVTLESKRILLERAMRESWFLVSTHDAAVPWGRLAEGEKGPRLIEPELNT